MDESLPKITLLTVYETIIKLMIIIKLCCLCFTLLFHYKC